MLTGENSIINRAIQAKEEVTFASEKEALQLAVVAAMLNGDGTLTTEKLNKELQANMNENVEVAESEFGWVYEGNKTYQISKDGKVKESLVPIGYQEVEYLESTGTQYIDTEFIPNQDTRIIADFQYTKNNQGYRFTGTQGTNGSSNPGSFRFGSSEGIYWLVGYGKIVRVQVGNSDTDRHILDFNKNIVNLDGNLLYEFDYETFTGYSNIYIFSINSANIADLAPTKLYAYTLYDGENLTWKFHSLLSKI